MTDQTNMVAGAVAEIEAILSKSTMAKEEAMILGILRPLEPIALAAVLSKLDLERLLSALDDRRWGPKSRKEFLRLAEPGIPHLCLDTKARLIRSLARGAEDRAVESIIVKLLLAETGERLTELKLLIDCSRDGRDLLHILTNFLVSADLRLDLVKHFQSAVSEEERILRVVSDIDDTLYSSLNDIRYPKGTIYPGVLELLAELSDTPPVFLTARPELVSSLFERVTHKQLSSFGIERCTVLSGSLPGLLGHRRMAEQKARTLTSYRELYPEFRFLFIGDSGQGDMALAQNLVARSPRLIEHAFIHKLGEHQPGSKSRHKRIYTFENYAVAATQMGTLGYLSEPQVKRIEQTVT